jgi:GMP synthase (glutamine-hydrolysing)
MRVLAIVHQPDAGPGVFAEAVAAAGHRLELWRPANQGQAPPSLDSYAAVMTFGGGMHPDQDDLHPWLADEKRLLADALDRSVPVLAVCLGAELLAQAAAGSARRSRRPEIGWYPVFRAAEAGRDPLIGPLPARFDALEWHSYESVLPPGAVPLARSDTCIQAYRVNGCAWGVQFHAEVTLRTFESWLERYVEDPDAVKMGIDPEQLRDQTSRAIRNWNRMGHELCTRFLHIAAGVPGVPPAHAG